jgi:hypothetical protein
MLIYFFDVNGIVHKEFVPPGQTVNQCFYLDILKRHRDSVRCKRPELWRSGDWLLHHDNAPGHTALCLTVVSEEQHGPSAPPTLLAQPSSMPPFFISTDEENSEREAIQ